MKYRPDIDVLRCIAVLGVLFFHAGFHASLGGYVGVDIFFVISGFLITDKIEREISGHTFTFRSFYIGRARRLFPALFATVVATLLFAAPLMASDHLKQVAASAIWTALSVSNVYFWLGSGYWAADSILKPLLHTWSLSVEEQFYLVWPFALALLSRFRPPVLPIVLSIAGAASFVAAAWYFGLDRDATFFLTPFRVFEFAAGALLVRLNQLPKNIVINRAVSVLGFCMIVSAMIWFRDNTPTSLMIIPCLGAAFIIYGGVAPSLEQLWQNAVAVYIGRISYSIYLVHWPIIILYEYWRYEQINTVERAALVIASILLAVPLHHFVEQRYRYSKYTSQVRFVAAWTLLSAVLVMVACATWGAIKQTSPPLSDPWIVAHLAQPLCEGHFGLCNGGNPSVVVIGDSHAAHLSSAIAQTMKELRLNASLYPVLPACPLVLDIYPADPPHKRVDCTERKKEWLSRIELDNPRVVILAGLWEEGMGAKGFFHRYTLDYASNELPRSDAKALWAAKMKETVDFLVKGGRKVVLIGNGPLLENPPAICFDRPTFLGKFDCAKSNAITDPDIHAYTRSVLRNIKGGQPNVFFFDTWEYLCDDNRCALSDGSQSFYYDRHHFTAYGAMWLQHHAFQQLSDFIREAVAQNPY